MGNITSNNQDCQSTKNLLGIELTCTSHEIIKILVNKNLIKAKFVDEGVIVSDFTVKPLGNLDGTPHLLRYKKYNTAVDIVNQFIKINVINGEIVNNKLVMYQ